MHTYAALLRGIMPSNPNMKNERLRAVFEGLGFSNVKTVISSGNVIFDSKMKDIPALEKKIETALLKELGIKSPAYIRSKEELRHLLKKDPFKGLEHGRKLYLIVSFVRSAPREIFTIIDMTAGTAGFMRDIEKKYDKDVTTRTWKTVERILTKMNIV